MQTSTHLKANLPNILNMLPAFIYIQNQDYTIEFHNKAFSEIFGEPKGRRCHEIFHNSKFPCDPCRCLDLLRSKKSHAFESQDHKGKNYMLYHYFYEDADGASKMLVAGIDISQEIATRNALKESEERYRNLYEHAPVMLHSLNPEGRIVHVSEQCLLQLEYERKDVVGRNFVDFLSDDSRRLREKETLPRLLSSGECKDVHYQYLSKSGEILDVLLSAVPEKDSHGDIRWILAVSIDVTERMKTEKALQQVHEELESQVQKRTEAYLRSAEKLKREIEERKLTEDALRRSEKKYSTLVENSLIGIYIKQDGKIVFANERFCEIHGYTHSEMVGIESWRLVHPADRAKVEDYSLKRLQKLDAPTQYEARGLTRDHRVIWVVRNNTRIIYRGKPAILGNLMDITRRKRVENHLQKSDKELRMLSTQLLAAQENERKRVALELHDTIAQSLVTIKFTLAQKLKQMGNPEPPEGVTIEAIIDLVQANITEVRRLMTALRPSLLDDLGILATINWHCREFQAIYNHIEIEKEIHIEEDEVPHDLKIVIFRILQEAMNNIAKHSQASRLYLFLNRENGTLLLSVKDNGRGFNYQEAVSNATDTKGLGIIGMRERAELSYGTFNINSRKNEGTQIQAVWQVG